MGGVANEHHGCFRTECLDTAGEGLVGHVVLHDVNECAVGTFFLSGELVEGDAVPVSDQPDSPGGVVYEEFRDGYLTPGDQHAMR